MNSDALIEFLSEGGSYGLPDEPVTRIDTHAAMVFLVGRRAYKMKRAVRYSFLDFSTLAKRKHTLEAELRLNRRTAPQLYRRLVAVTGSLPDRLSLVGADEDPSEGEPIEWLLEMVRFDQEDVLDHMAETGPLDEAVIERLAEAIVALHDAADIRKSAGGYAAMAEIVRGNAADLEGVRGKLDTGAPLDLLIDGTNRELEARRALLEERRRAGFVRHCHGDLHLGNIVLFDGVPVLFDCLEFDEALATTDTLYDLAFLLMDLCRRDLTVLGNRLLNAYLDATWDDGGTALLPLFMAVRAAIRAKIHAIDADLAEQAGDRDTHRAACARYLDLAVALLDSDPPRLIAIAGVSGTGKSSVARALAPDEGAAPGAIILRSDVIRKRLFGVAATDRLPESAYGPAVSRRVYDTIAERARRLLEAGRAVIVDAACLDPAQRATLAAVALDTGVTFRGIWLTGDPRRLADRITRRHGDASDATVAVLTKQLETATRPAGWHAIDTGPPLEQVVAHARTALRPGS